MVEQNERSVSGPPGIRVQKVADLTARGATGDGTGDDSLAV